MVVKFILTFNETGTERVAKLLQMLFRKFLQNLKKS